MSQRLWRLLKCVLIVEQGHPEWTCVWLRTMVMSFKGAGRFGGQVLGSLHPRSHRQRLEGVEVVVGSARYGSGWGMLDVGT